MNTLTNSDRVEEKPMLKNCIPMTKDAAADPNRSRRRQLTTAGLATLAMVLGSWGLPAAAQASTSFERVINRQTVQCLDVWWASTEHAATVGVANCVGGSNQLWDFQEAGGGFKYIKVRHTGMCLDVAYFGEVDGADVVQASCSGGTNQQWIVTPFDGYNLIIARHSGKCLDKAGNGDVVQWTCHGGKWQQWKRSETGIPTG